MHPKLWTWLLSGHIIGVLVWVGAMFATYWLLRMHAHSPKDMHERFTLMERSMALTMDIASALAIGCGIALIVVNTPSNPTGNLLTQKPAGWLHIKLAVVVLGVLPVHGMIRARVKKFSQGKLSPVPNWQWTLLLAAITAIVILVFVVRHAMLRG